MYDNLYIQRLTCCFVCVCVCVFAVSDHLPEVSDHHADTDTGPAAVCCASLPNRRGQCFIFLWYSETVCVSIECYVYWVLHLSFPQRDLLGIQHLLNSSEASLHQLTALLDCRGLNKVQSHRQICLHRWVVHTVVHYWIPMHGSTDNVSSSTGWWLCCVYMQCQDCGFDSQGHPCVKCLHDCLHDSKSLWGKKNILLNGIYYCYYMI